MGGPHDFFETPKWAVDRFLEAWRPPENGGSLIVEPGAGRGMIIRAASPYLPGYGWLAVEIRGEGGPITVLPFLQDHGDIPSLGFRFGPVAYSSDLVDLPDASVKALAGLDLWIVDALRYKPHPSHFSVDDALGWIERLRPRRAVLTNLHADLDYAELKTRLPSHIEPAYDGMRVQVS